MTTVVGVLGLTAWSYPVFNFARNDVSSAYVIPAWMVRKTETDGHDMMDSCYNLEF